MFGHALVTLLGTWLRKPVHTALGILPMNSAARVHSGGFFTIILSRVFAPFVALTFTRVYKVTPVADTALANRLRLCGAATLSDTQLSKPI